MRWCHIPIFQSESVITVTRTTVAVQAFQFLNISFCYTLFCFFSQLVNHPLRTLLWPGRGPDFQLVVFAAMVTSYARSSSSIKARYLDPQTSFILQTYVNWLIEHGRSGSANHEIDCATKYNLRTTSRLLNVHINHECGELHGLLW